MLSSKLSSDPIPYKKQLNISPDDQQVEKEIEEVEIYPEYVKSQKEKECWKLFKKMSNRGVSVSYDTILRGMLTPTEFRALQKQKDLEAQRIAEEEQLQNEQSDELAKDNPKAEKN